jgi:hypothetical protein
MTIGFTHPGIGFGIRSMMIGSLKTVPPRIFRIYGTWEMHVIRDHPGRKDASDTHGTVGTPPHLLEVEFY